MIVCEGLKFGNSEHAAFFNSSERLFWLEFLLWLSIFSKELQLATKSDYTMEIEGPTFSSTTSLQKSSASSILSDHGGFM